MARSAKVGCLRQLRELRVASRRPEYHTGLPIAPVASPQHFLAGAPEAGDLVQGTGGFRKVRWHDRRRGKGARGGLRVIYYHLLSESQIWLLTLYDKGEVADLTPAEKRMLKAALEAELAKRAVKRQPRRK